jgi:hypothetical protein
MFTPRIKKIAQTIQQIATGGTGATTAAAARNNLGLGAMALQAAGSVAISGGAILGTAIDNCVIGATTPVAGTFTNVTISGSARRITGDFTNATAANRTLFQTSTANSQTTVGAIPLGSGNGSRFATYGAADPDNATMAHWQTVNGATSILFGRLGTGTWGPFIINSPSAFGGLDEIARFGETGAQLDVYLGGNTATKALRVIGNNPATPNNKWVEISGAPTGVAVSIGASSGNLALVPASGNVLVGAPVSASAKLNVQDTVDVMSSTGVPKMNVLSRAGAIYQPPQITLNRVGSTGGATPDNVQIGEIRFDGLDTGLSYANTAMISVQAGTNAAGGPPAAMLFSTSTGGGAAAERARIGTSGRFETIADTAAGFNFVARARAADDVSAIVFYNNAASIERARITVASGGAIQFLTGAAVEQLRVANIASAVNSWQIQGATSGNAVYLGTISGVDSNVSISLYTKGNGSVFFQAQSGTSTEFAVLANGATATAYWQAYGGSGGSPVPAFSIAGGPTDIAGQMLSKGAGPMYIGSTTGGGQVAIIPTATPSTAQLTLLGATGTTVSPQISVQGSGSNLAVDFVAKGTGAFGFHTRANTTNNKQVVIADPGASPTTSWLTLQGCAAGGLAAIIQTGPAADGMQIVTSVSGGIFLGSRNGNAYGLAILDSGSATTNRYVTITGSNGATPKIATNTGSLEIGSPVVFSSQTTGTTVGATGAAAALPAFPLGYLTTSINGTPVKIPYYNN